MDMQEDITHFQEQQVNGPFQFNANGIVVAAAVAPPSRRRCRRRSSSSAARSAATRRRSRTRTCTSGGATRSPTPSRSTRSSRRATPTCRSTSSSPTTPAWPPARRARTRTRRRSRRRSRPASTGTDVQHDQHDVLGRRAGRTRPRATCSPTANTYTRPGMSYIALRAILGADNFRKASTEIQTTYRYGAVVPAGRDRDLPQVDAEPVDRLLEQARRVLQAVVGHVLHGFAGGGQQAADHGPGPGRRRLL